MSQREEFGVPVGEEEQQVPEEEWEQPAAAQERAQPPAAEERRQVRRPRGFRRPLVPGQELTCYRRSGTAKVSTRYSR
jgi:hypothetical protein